MTSGRSALAGELPNQLQEVASIYHLLSASLVPNGSLF